MVVERQGASEGEGGARYRWIASVRGRKRGREGEPAERRVTEIKEYGDESEGEEPREGDRTNEQTRRGRMCEEGNGTANSLGLVGGERASGARERAREQGKETREQGKEREISGVRKRTLLLPIVDR